MVEYLAVFQNLSDVVCSSLGKELRLVYLNFLACLKNASINSRAYVSVHSIQLHILSSID